MAKAKPKAERQHQMTQEELAEFSACSPVQGAAGFIRFCQKHVKIECKLTKTIIPFVLYDCQRDLAGKLVLGLWLIVLKARQLGITWLVSAYVVWRMTYDRFFSAVIVNQSKTYAQDFIGKKCKLIWENLPPFLRHQLRADTLTRLEFGDGQPDGHKAESNAVAGNSNAACSWTVVLAVYDEGARIADLQPARDAIEPALANVKGQAVIVSTSLGPSGDFYRYWKKAVKAEKARKVEEERTGEPVPHQPRVLVPIFYPWDAHPDRDEAWYAAEKAAHAEDPLYMPQNFPRTPDEAFMAAGCTRPVTSTSLPSARPAPSASGRSTTDRVLLRSSVSGCTTSRATSPG